MTVEAGNAVVVGLIVVVTIVMADGANADTLVYANVLARGIAACAK